MYKSKKHKSSKQHHHHQQDDAQGWKWDDGEQNWYFLTVDENGASQILWAPRPEKTASKQREIPKSHVSSVETLTRGMQSLSHGTYDTQPAADESYTVASGSRSKSKGKGKENEDDNDEDSDDTTRGYGDDTARSPKRDPEAINTQSVPQRTHSTNDALKTEDSVAASSAYRGSSYGGESSYRVAYSMGTTPIAYSHESPEVRAEMSKYSEYAYSSTSYGGPSTEAYSYEGYEEEEGRATPKAHQGGSTFEVFDELEEEGKLDARYRVRPSSAFQPGSIFMVYWAEPKGSNKDDVSSKRSFENKLGVKFYYGIRRFIVVANDQGHATVVPVLTYGRKACKKKGVKPEKHGIIYQQGHRARLLDREPQLGFEPVCAEITEEGERLSKESRVNYSKLTSVEHNCRVLFIGHIVSTDFDTVHDAVNACWEAKTHHRRRHRH